MTFNELSAQDLIEGYKNGSFKIHTVIEKIIEAIQETQPSLNALAENRFEEALLEAKSKQVLVEQEKVDWKKYPLWGLPVTTTEMLAVKGMRQTLGTLDRKDWISHENSTLIERLENLGAIIIGTTNVSELGFWFECFNPVYGVTRNPLNLDYSSGGGSGGEGALVGAGITPIGIGSDFNGGIRIPASFCGCLGYKPTPGVLPLTGHFPAIRDYWDQWIKKTSMTSLGFISHHPSDLLWFTQLLSGYDQKDLSSNTPTLNWNKLPVNPKVFVISDPDFDGAYRADTEVVTAVENVGKYLRAIGYEVISLPSDFFEDSLSLWLERVRAEKVDSFFNLISPLKKRLVSKELLLKVIGKKQFDWPTLILAALDKLKGSTKSDSDHYKRKMERVHQLLNHNAVILLPTHPRSGIKHNQSLFRPFDFIYTATANLYNLPALQIPIAKSEQTGLPIGCQVWSHPFQDHLALFVGETIYDTFNVHKSG
jgi:fatty acid amide hydrolase 2